MDHPINLLLCVGGNDDADVQTELENIYEHIATEFPDTSAVIASSVAQEKSIWALREDTDLIYRKHPGASSHDVSVPLSQVDAYISRIMTELKTLDNALAPYVFGHLADGNLHIVLNAARDELSSEKAVAIESILYRDLSDMGGSFSAEHGVGSKRLRTLQRHAQTSKLVLMNRIKSSMDPRFVLNRNKVLSTSRDDT
jgi:FAD/FMN-containing dehydrogenase